MQVKRDKTLALVREMQRAREETELRECTFRPRINRTSAALMADRSEALKTLQVCRGLCLRGCVKHLMQSAWQGAACCAMPGLHIEHSHFTSSALL